ncbi:MAG: YdcF family protein [Chromatiaceae bacterium]|jgi:uncharacterized SAM-binding protein YcdF (DUF218 family)
MCIVIAVFIAYVAVIELKIASLNQAAASKRYSQMVVLGAKVNAAGPSLSLKSRLDLSLIYYKANPDIKIVVSGGQGADEPVTEAEAMAKYLVANGVEARQITLEDKSLNTFENITLSAAFIDPRLPVLVVTNDYHALRSCLIASSVGLDAYCAGAETPSHVWIKLRMREYVAIFEYGLSQLLPI